MSINLPDQSASLPFQDLVGQTVALDKRKTVKQDLSNNYQSTSPYQTSHLLDWPSSLPFYPACDQCQLPQGGMSLQAQLSPQDYNRFASFQHSTMGKISVNQTRGHRCYNWLCESVRSSLSPVLTLFFG